MIFVFPLDRYDNRPYTLNHIVQTFTISFSHIVFEILVVRQYSLVAISRSGCILLSSALASTPTLVEAEVSFNMSFSTPPTRGLKFYRRPQSAKLSITQHSFNPTIFWGWGWGWYMGHRPSSHGSPFQIFFF